MDDARPSGEGDEEHPFDEGMLRAIYHSVDDAIFVHDADTGEIVDANETACELYGYSRAELRQLAVADLSSGTPPYTNETAVEYLQQANEGDPQLFEWQAEDSDGNVFWVEVSMRRAAVDDDAFVLVIVRDIDERKRREQELRSLTEEYETVVENAPDAVFLVDVESTGEDVDFSFERLNPAHETTSGLTTEEAFGEDIGAEVAANYRRCVETREPVTYEEEHPTPDGRIVWQTSLAPVVVDGDVTRIVGVARDITERVEQERQLQQQNDRLDEFASVISHDLRNPLNVAQGRATLLREQCDDEYLDHLDPVVEALDRMEAIIEDTLTLAREGRTVSETEPIDIVDLVGQCWRVIETDEATLDHDDELTIRGDRDRLRHVFENLFRNAVDHGGEDVTVRVGRVGDTGFYVEDDGPGIPEDSRERVFEPGYTSDDDGTGFGLAIVKRMAEAHGWDVAIVDGEDGGARFEFTSVEVTGSPE
jgi:PAS domain S-box-containing protein